MAEKGFGPGKPFWISESLPETPYFEHCMLLSDCFYCRPSVEKAYDCLKTGLKNILQRKTECKCNKISIARAMFIVDNGKEALLKKICGK